MRMVQLRGQCKSILKQSDPFIALMAYRATPLAATGYSPSQLLMGRSIRTIVPTIQRNLAPCWPDPEKVRENDEKAKSDYRYYYNRRHSARRLTDIPVGSAVSVRTNKESDWSQSGMASNSDAPSLRSQSILMQSGRTLRRDRQDVRIDTSVNEPVTTAGSPVTQPGDGVSCSLSNTVPGRPPEVSEDRRSRRPTKRLIEHC